MFRFMHRVLFDPATIEESAPPTEEAPAAEAPAEETPASKPDIDMDDIVKSIEEASKEETPAQEKKEEAPAVKEEEKAPTVDEISVVESLQNIIQEMQAAQQQPKKEEEKEKIAIKFDPLTEEAYSALFKSPTSFDEHINGRVTSALKQYEEKTVPTITQVIVNTVRAELFNARTIEKFYDENSDLAPYKVVVGKIADDIQKKNPDKPWYTLLPDVAKVTREKLKLAKKIVEAKIDPAPVNRAPKGGKQPAAAPNLTPLEKEIEDLLK